MPQIVYRISDKQFFVERQVLASSAKISLISAICVKKISSLDDNAPSFAFFAPSCLCD
jgi:hypothetical protein